MQYLRRQYKGIILASTITFPNGKTGDYGSRTLTSQQKKRLLDWTFKQCNIKQPYVFKDQK